MKTKRLFIAAFFSVTAAVSSWAQINMSTLADVDGNLNDPSGVTTLTPDNDYLLDRRIYVPDGHQLYIQAGTIVKAVSFPDPADAAAIVVTRGGQIFALGTEHDPIIFTHEDDPLDGSFSIQNKELWGGLMVLGKAPNNILEGDVENTAVLLGIADGVGFIEGLPFPDERHHYGATDTLADGSPVFDENDNSGVIKYVSIRHGGTDIGDGNEINGLTLGAVGKGTTIEHIEVVSNGDDGIEFFGGNVDAKYINIMFCEDDYLDWDQGYNGRIQFMFGLQLPQTIVTATGQDNDTIRYGDNGMECDGDDGRGDERLFFSAPTVFNATIIGNGADEGLELKERTEGQIANCILANFGRGVRFEQTSSSETGVDYPGALQVQNNLFLNNGSNYSGSAAQGTALANDGNLFVTSTTILDTEIAASINNGLDVFGNTFNAVPASLLPEIETDLLPTFSDGFFDYAPYKGAFDPGETAWLAGWTLHDLKGTGGDIECEIDTNGDRNIDAIDFNNVVGNYNTTCN